MSALTYGTDPEGKAWLRFLSCTREPGTWKEELAAAARAIAQKADRPLWICSSGGLDSEIACRSFYDQGLHFSVLSLAYEGGANAYELRHAIAWCRDRGVTHRIVPFDMAAFLRHGMYVYAERYPAIHPFRYVQLKLLEMVDEFGGLAVLCSDDQLYRLRDGTEPPLAKRDLELRFSNGSLVPLHWRDARGTSHEPYFHFATPELCLSFLRLPLIRFAIEHPESVFMHRHNVHFLKTLVYQSVWTDVVPRRPSDGFNGLRRELMDAQSTLVERFGRLHEPIIISVDEFESQLTGRLGDPSTS